MLSCKRQLARPRRVLAVISVVAAVCASAAGAAFALSSQAPPASVQVTLKEWTLTPIPARAPAGKVVFQVTNEGTVEHELVVLRTNRAPSKLPVKRGRVIESVGGSRALEIGLQGKIEGIAPGETRTLVLTLRPGRYVLICNLLGHYRAGQFAGFRVTR